MTKLQFEKYKNQIIIGNTYSNFQIEEKYFYGYLKQAFKDAKTYFKLQKSALENGYPDDYIKESIIYDVNTKSLVNVGFKASKNYTLLQWIRICLGVDNLYLDNEKLRKFINHAD